jgi:hypothetical protein
LAARAFKEAYDVSADEVTEEDLESAIADVKPKEELLIR